MSQSNGRLLGQDRLQDVINKVLAHAKADQVQVNLSVNESALTRFAGSIIHQNVSERNASLFVKAIIGKKIGSAVGNAIDDESIRRTTERAVESAKNQQENPDFVSLPSPKPIAPAPQTYFENTASFSPEDRAQAVAKVVAAADKVDAHAAGSVQIICSEQAIGNSLGISAYLAETGCALTTVVTADTGFGYANRLAHDVSTIDVPEAAAEAAETAAKSKNPISIEPGEYDVVLTPYCVEDMVGFLSWLGFSSLAVEEGRSFMAGKFGQKVMGDNITIWDDGHDPRTRITPFDGEGYPTQRVDLIVNGVANAVVYDSYTANKTGKTNTGHATGGSGMRGAFATNMLLAPGTATIDEMIASTERGIFVTRFNYTNVVHPLLAIFTGMTRDGTFLIENGKITKPVKNLRFTESILKALSNVEMIGKDLSLQGMATVPALKVRSFRFTGATEF